MTFCRARTRRGRPCKNRALANGLCRAHQALALAATTGDDIAIRARGERESDEQAARIRTKIAAYLDVDPLDMSSELATLRALLDDSIERYARVNGDDLAGAIAGLVNHIGRLAARMSKFKQESALTQAEINDLAARAVEIIQRYIDDPQGQTAFVEDLFGEFVPGRTLPAGEGEREPGADD